MNHGLPMFALLERWLSKKGMELKKGGITNEQVKKTPGD